ncbi:hypothetical protein AN958_07104 [Leucoagaricus sp. SymC.cos]|nr:hypothetical protein AN958_07104 [Leucoagaricus sp. SymC.cos]
MSNEEVQSQPERLSFQGSCFCGDATFRVEGEPLISVFCHCTVCQRLNGCSVVHGLHYPSGSFTWTHGNPDAIFTKASKGHAWTVWRCQRCYTFIAAHNGSEEKWSVKGSHFKRNAKGSIENWDLVKPTAHIFYSTRMFDVLDDLPKWEGYEYKSARMFVGAVEENSEGKVVA